MTDDLVIKVRNVMLEHGLPNGDETDDDVITLLRGLPEDILQSILTASINADVLAGYFADMYPGGCWRKRNEYGRWLEFFGKWLPAEKQDDIFQDALVLGESLSGDVVKCQTTLKNHDIESNEVVPVSKVTLSLSISEQGKSLNLFTSLTVLMSFTIFII